MGQSVRVCLAGRSKNFELMLLYVPLIRYVQRYYYFFN